MSFVIKEEGLPNLSDRGSRWGTTVCVFINKIGQILSGPGICGTLGSTTYPRTQVCLANPKMSRLNRKYNIMFSSHYLTFGTQKQRFTHMPNKEAHEKANWPVLVLVRLALIKAVAQCELCASEINPNSGKTLLILYKSVENKASTALQQLLGCVFNIPRPNPALPLPYLHRALPNCSAGAAAGLTEICLTGRHGTRGTQFMLEWQCGKTWMGRCTGTANFYKMKPNEFRWE